MDAGTAPPESGVASKEGVATDNIAATQSEPTSGAAVEMSGALATERSGDGVPATIGDEPKKVNGPVTTSSEAPQAAAETTATESKVESGGATADDTEMQDVDQPAPVDVALAEDTAPKTNGTPAAKKGGDNKRRSSAGVPEHKSKKLNKKKSAAKITHLDAAPGEYYFARLKSYPPWPSMVCDEEMLPQTLLSSRPITTKKDDGTYNEAYADGGKKVLDRTFPVMFMHTNEFAWIPNTDLSPLNPEDCKDVAEKGKSKTLYAAYQVAAENHSLQYFKDMLVDHARAVQEEVELKEAKQAEKVAKADKKKRKSEAKPEPDDVEMEDADDAPAEPKKSSKKRKKEADAEEEEPEKPAKTPKTTKLKLTTNKTPTTTEKKPKEKAPKPKSEKKKASKSSPSDEEPSEVREEEPEKPLDPAEARKAREKEVLFLRHKLQKGFLSREQAPQEDEMPQMSNFIKKLENYEDLEVSIIRATKINKVLKALIKLNTIPKDEEYEFRKRSVELLSKWNKILGAEPADGETTGSGEKDTKSTPTTNGVHDDKSEEKKDDTDKPMDSTEKPSSDAEAAPKVTTDEPSKFEEVQSSVVEEPKPSIEGVSAKAEAPVVETPSIDKAPASAEGAAQVQEVVKANE